MQTDASRSPAGKLPRSAELRRPERSAVRLLPAVAGVATRSLDWLRPQLCQLAVPPSPIDSHADMHIDSKIKTFGGVLYKVGHASAALNCDMKFNLFIPGSATPQKPLPVMFYLSGLTCTPDNVTEKGGFFSSLDQYNIAIVFPDTSPRGTDLPGEHDDWDFGSAAGFYLNATQKPWSEHYKMESYIVDELPALLAQNFDQINLGKKSILGHSMGGYGALSLFLRHPGAFKCVSAFSPIANPIECPWGQKAFKGYLGDDQQEWKKHDPTELVLAYQGPTTEILIDCGTGDQFYQQGQLLPENFEKAAQKTSFKVQLRLQPEYDHSYFFVASFAHDHVTHHAKYLR